MYLFAYDYGSIINVHLLLLSIIIPFSIDVSSLGNPQIFHDYILTSSPKNFLIDIISLNGILYSYNLVLQSVSILILYYDTNGPEYATIPAAIIELPGINPPLLVKFSISLAHLSFSSLNPSVSFYALSNLTSHSLIFFCKSSYYFFLSSKTLYNSLIFALISSSSFFLIANSLFFSSTILVINANFSLNGLVSV